MKQQSTNTPTPWNPSKKAIKRVLHPLPAPDECPFCKSEVKIVNNSELYGKEYGTWPWAYSCTKCRAYVGMHPLTNIPLGTLADEKTRAARTRAKALFQKLWQDGGTMTRSEAYGWLATRLEIPVKECHFGWFDVKTCDRAEKLLFGFANSN